MTTRHLALLLGLLVFCSRLTFITQSGTVVEKGTGKPISGVVLLRSWRRYWFNPVHPISNLVTFEETSTNPRGRFHLLGLSRVLYFSIPVLGPIEANGTLVFKSGYREARFATPPQLLELEKLPETYAARMETLERVDDPSSVDLEDTRLWKEAIEQEEVAVYRLKGVFYEGHEQEGSELVQPNDIAIDTAGRVYVTDTCATQPVWRFSPEGVRAEPLQGSNERKQERRRQRRFCTPYDLVWTTQQKLLAFSEATLYTVNPETADLERQVAEHPTTVQPPLAVQASRLLITAENRVVVLNCRNSPQPPALCAFDKEGALQKEVPLQTVTSPPEPIWPIDLASANDGVILLLYTRHANSLDGGVMKFDSHLNLLSHEPLSWASTVTSLTTTRGAVIIADTGDFSVYDSGLRLKYREQGQSAERGKVQLTRIKADPQGEYLYLLDQQGRRILRYHLPTRQWAGGRR